MKNCLTIFFVLGFAFANVHAQEFSKPTLASPEATFYEYLDNENISDPTKYKGNVKKVTRTFKEYGQGIDASTIEKTTMYVNRDNILEKTITRTYAYGIEDTKDEVNHLEEPSAEIKKDGKLTVKIIKRQQPEEDEYLPEPDMQGDDHYVYKKDRLIAFYNDNDSISYRYDKKDRLIEIKYFESLISEEFNEDDESTTLWRSQFQDKGLERISYRNDLPVRKIIYDKFGEVIDIYEKTYTYTEDKKLKKFETLYKRYLFDYYVDSIAIDQQKYAEFPTVEMNDSIQKGTFVYSPTKKIQSYKRTKGEENEAYQITFDKNDQLYYVEGILKFYQQGKLATLPVEYEYLYDDKGNPSSIKSFYYVGGEKMLHRETTFDIEYY
ncbi:hypothetical protein [Kordia sp.]|uniref:hypothetical protein n=1 Tax=Kordia sp. TaxID=1965332 RepID=UPI003B5AFD4D